MEIDITGNWEKTLRWLKQMTNIQTKFDAALEKAGREGVRALEAATPKNTGLASSAWFFDIKKGPLSSTIEWHNADIEGGYNVALLIQYGHGTGTGGYVRGLDYINPALAPVFESFANEVLKEVDG